jgi:magnesium-transporting ATPase (P-type)
MLHHNSNISWIFCSYLRIQIRFSIIYGKQNSRFSCFEIFK